MEQNFKGNLNIDKTASMKENLNFEGNPGLGESTFSWKCLGENDSILLKILYVKNWWPTVEISS